MGSHRLALFTAFIMCLWNCAQGQTYASGLRYEGTNEYVSYHAGNLPLIISVPHGGLLDPDEFPDRSCSNCVTINDTNTRALGLSLQEELKSLTGCDVHLVVNELHRRKMDANREINEATLGNAEAELAWTEYHAFLDSARNEVIRSWGRGLIIDLHGHGHSIQRLELGYRLTPDELRMSDSNLDQRMLIDLPIKTLVDSTSRSLSDIIRGDQSLGSLFEQKNVNAVPSNLDNAPQGSEPYFRGGFITNTYGSKDNSPVDAIQIECHQDVRFQDFEREQFADELALVLLEFIQIHYYPTLTQNFCNSTAARRISRLPSIKVFPNPVCETVQLPSELQVERARLIDITGRYILTFTGTNSLNVSGLQNGLYILVVESDKKLYRQQLSVICN